MTHYEPKLLSAYNKLIYEINKGDMLSERSRPSFKHFVNYLIETDVQDYNDHWMPIWLHCHLCSNHTDFNFVGSLENAKEDSKFIMEKSGIFDILHQGELKVE